VPPHDTVAERGRAAALAAVRQDEFNCLGPYSDAGPGQCQELREYWILSQGRIEPPPGWGE